MKRSIIAAAASAILLSGTALAAADVPLAKRASDPAIAWGPCPTIFPAGCEITILRGDPSRPNADALLRIPAGYAIPAHSHTSAERMVLVSGKMTVQYQGHAATTLEAGDYAYGPAGLPHKAVCEAGGQCVLFIAFEQAVDAVPFTGAISGPGPERG